MNRMKFRFKVICSSGVLVQGGSSDFLVCIVSARESKQEWSRLLPLSILRVQFFYQNNKRVPSEDIKAALRALAATSISAAVAARRAAFNVIPPARSEARTAGITLNCGRGFASAFDFDFCQAGVVAPPDSPDLGNLPVSSVATVAV